MKKIFIGLLLMAAGAGIVSCNPGNTSDRISGKGLIVGEWQMDSVDISKTKDSTLGLLALVFIAQDSLHNKLRFTFHAGGLITEESGDNGPDSSRYQWEGEKALVISGQDSVSEKWTIKRLDSVKLVVTADDSVTFYFNRTKQK